MTGVVNWFAKKADQLGGHTFGYQLGSYTHKAPQPEAPPTQDVAANASKQNQDLLRRRRSVMANIFAGNSASAPPTTSKSQLGN